MEKTQTLSARLEEPSRLSAPAEPSWLAIAYLNKWRVLHPLPLPPLDQLTLLLLTLFCNSTGVIVKLLFHLFSMTL